MADCRYCENGIVHFIDDYNGIETPVIKEKFVHLLEHLEWQYVYRSRKRNTVPCAEEKWSVIGNENSNQNCTDNASICDYTYIRNNQS